MKSRTSIIATGLFLGSAILGQATVIGFGNLGGNNTTVPGGLASNATADGNGFVVSNGTTPNIALTWDSQWDIHTSFHFDTLEALTVGGGAWDNEGDVARIGQLDAGNHTILFSADAGYALALNSFDFGHTAETAGTTVWDITLTDSGTNVVWSSLGLSLTNTSVTLAPGFTGTDGEDYTLTFNRISETYGSNGRHGLDNLNFTQVPEPSTALLAGLAGIGLFVRRRK